MNKKYLTVKEFADAAKISQQAVYKQISGRLKPFIKVEGNKKMIAAAALKEFYSIDNSDDSTQVEQVDQPNSTSKNNDIQPLVEGVEQLNSTKISNDKKQNILEDQIKDLQKQIQEILKNDQEEKKFLRDQIKQKDKQIESLTENLKIAQQLAAADKKKLLELEDKQKEQETIDIEDQLVREKDKPPENFHNEAAADQPKKKGFFAKLFGRQEK